jgi:hypothetical protein
MTKKQLAEVLFNISIDWKNRPEEATKLIVKELKDWKKGGKS